MKNILNFLISAIITIAVSAAIGFIALIILSFIASLPGNEASGNIGLGFMAYAMKYIFYSIIVGLVIGIPSGISFSRRFKIK